MATNWKQEFIRLTLALSAITLIAAFFDRASLGLIIGLLGYLVWTLRQMEKIRIWLANPTAEPPESPGLWGEIYDGIYNTQRRNIEEKSRLQATVEYLQDSFSSLADGVVMIDKRDNIVWSNKSAEDLLGINYPEDQNQYLANLIRDPLFTNYINGRKFTQHLELTSPVNEYVTLQIHITFFGKKNKLLFARNVTKMIQLEHMRQDFIGNVSHELRTPLTVIRGYLETFQDFHLTDDHRWNAALEQMLGQTHRMDALVRDLITLSRLETIPESQQPEKIYIADLTANICNELTAAGIDQRELINECPANHFLLGNPDEIRSAFTNLLTNAIKYTNNDGKIWITWEISKKGRGCYKVKDNGIGIGAEHIPRLTERFYRVDKSRSVKTGGTGLGLAIVKHILIRHKATLKIESKANEGSTFTCWFKSTEIGIDEVALRQVAHE